MADSAAVRKPIYLSDEIWSYVVEELRPRPRDAFIDAVNGTRDLAALCRVNRQLYGLAHPVLWDTVTFDLNHWPQVPALLHALVKFPELAKLVHTIRIDSVIDTNSPKQSSHVINYASLTSLKYDCGLVIENLALSQGTRDLLRKAITACPMALCINPIWSYPIDQDYLRFIRAAIALVATRTLRVEEISLHYAVLAVQDEGVRMGLFAGILKEIAVMLLNRPLAAQDDLCVQCLERLQVFGGVSCLPTANSQQSSSWSGYCRLPNVPFLFGAGSSLTYWWAGPAQLAPGDSQLVLDVLITHRSEKQAVLMDRTGVRTLEFTKSIVGFGALASLVAGFPNIESFELEHLSYAECQMRKDNDDDNDYKHYYLDKDDNFDDEFKNLGWCLRTYNINLKSRRIRGWETPKYSRFPTRIGGLRALACLAVLELPTWALIGHDHDRDPQNEALLRVLPPSLVVLSIYDGTRVRYADGVVERQLYELTQEPEELRHLERVKYSKTANTVICPTDDIPPGWSILLHDSGFEFELRKSGSLTKYTLEE